MNARCLLLVLTLCSLPAGAGAAQESAPPDSTQALLVVDSSPESAWVMLDTASIGKTPCSLAVHAPASYHLRLQHPDLANWLTGAVEETLAVRPGEIVRRTYQLPVWTLVVSSPMGAEIFAGDSLLGSSPLLLRPGKISRSAPLTARLRGYESATANPAMATRGVLRIPLRASTEPGTFIDQRLLDIPRPSSTRLYLTGGGALLAGAAAAYFKVKADNANSDYILNGDPASLSDRNRYDRASGVFLVVTQVSLGLFLAFLMSE
jgi:hypothetical protein